MKKSYHSIVVPTALATATRRASVSRSVTTFERASLSMRTVFCTES
jgi:hypothetical protein